MTLSAQAGLFAIQLKQTYPLYLLTDIIDILSRCKKKQPAAEKEFYEKYYGFALKIVFRYIYRYEKAVDVANDSFIKFFKHIDRFTVKDAQDTEKVVMGYLKRILINSSIDALRKDKMMPEIGGIPDYVWDIPQSNEAATDKLLYKDIIKMIKNLSPRYRSVFNLFVIDGYNHLEISDLLKIPVGTSKSSLSRARILLQEMIKKTEEIKIC